MNKTAIAVTIAAALFSGTAFAVSGNPENPDASTKNWQLDELRQSVNNQFSDVNNRIDQIQAGSSFDASGIYEHLERHDDQIDVLNNGVANAQNTANDASETSKEALNVAVGADLRSERALHEAHTASNQAQHASDLAEGANAKAEEANKNALDAKDQAVKAQNTANRADYKADAALHVASDALRGVDRNTQHLKDHDQQLADHNYQLGTLKDTTDKHEQALVDHGNRLQGVEDKNAQQDKDINNNKQDIQKVKNDVKVVSRDVANNSIRIQRNEERIDGAYAGIYDNRKNIDANRQAINRNSQEIQKLNKNFSDLKNTVDANRKRAAAGIAGVAAMANIPEVNSHQTFSLGVGVGGFDGQQAIAVGASARVNDNLTVKASVAANNEEVVWGAGAAIGW